MYSVLGSQTMHNEEKPRLMPWAGWPTMVVPSAPLTISSGIFTRPDRREQEKGLWTNITWFYENCFHHQGSNANFLAFNTSNAEHSQSQILLMPSLITFWYFIPPYVDFSSETVHLLANSSPLLSISMFIVHVSNITKQSETSTALLPK